MTNSPDPVFATLPLDPRTFGSYRKILFLSGPLILSHLGVMVMQMVDGLFLARYSKNAIAAVGPAGMDFWVLCGFCMGLVGYTNTFVAQYMGANRPQRVGAAVWQGIYLACGAAVLLFAASFAAPWVFNMVGHEEAIQRDEVVYFTILCYGGLAFMLSGALAGFFAGRNDNVHLMTALITGNIVNAVGAWAMVFGHLGFPEMGMRGAALATVAGQTIQVLIMAWLFFRPRFRRDFATWRDRKLDPRLMARMCAYGLPNGVRYVAEILAWAIFLQLLGRADSDGLAASNIVWRINGLAFFPVIGLANAVSMLVGQAQGAGRPDLSRQVTRRGIMLGQIWMTAAALLMVLIPHVLLNIFLEPGATTDHELRGLAVILLRFVAVYCLLDGVNIMLMAVLAGAGDTQWMLWASGAVHLGFIIMLAVLAWYQAGVYAFWTAATVFICSAIWVWIIRFRSDKWESKRVIEHKPLDLETTPVPG